LTGSSDLSLSLKIQYAIKVLLAFTPVAYLLDSLNLWFVENSQFFSFVIYTLFINIIVGGWYHHVKKTFDWNQFLWKNIQMWIVIVLAYPILEFMRQIAGQNSVGEVFKVTIQIATLLYPASKILKNIYILSNKQYPPSFIMDKIYKFEKDGNVTDLLGKENEDNINEENIEP
jgi:hypothetical protein